MGAGRTWRGATWAVALAVGAVLVGQPALADDGLSTGGRSRYVLDPKATTVTGTVTIDLRNTTPNRGGFFYYYDAFSVPVPAGAEKVRARSGGSSLAVSLKGTEDSGGARRARAKKERSRDKERSAARRTKGHY